VANCVLLFVIINGAILTILSKIYFPNLDLQQWDMLEIRENGRLFKGGKRHIAFYEWVCARPSQVWWENEE